MTDKLPWMPFYGARFYEDETVGLMELAEEAVYLRLLWRQWREGSLPGEAVDLERLAGGPVTPRVLSCLPRGDDNRRRNPEMERIRAIHLDHSERLAAAGRKGGIKSGRSRGQARPKPGLSKASSPRQAGPKQIKNQIQTTDSSATWLTPFADGWKARCGNPPFGRLAKCLAPLRDDLGEPEALARWSRYLSGNEPRYCSPERFLATHQSYAGPETCEMTDDYGRMVLHTKRDGWWGYDRDGQWVRTIEVSKASA